MKQSVYDAQVAGRNARRIAQNWHGRLEKFWKMRENYLIYS